MAGLLISVPQQLAIVLSRCDHVQSVLDTPTYVRLQSYLLQTKYAYTCRVKHCNVCVTLAERLASLIMRCRGARRERRHWRPPSTELARRWAEAGQLVGEAAQEAAAPGVHLQLALPHASARLAVPMTRCDWTADGSRVYTRFSRQVQMGPCRSGEESHTFSAALARTECRGPARRSRGASIVLPVASMLRHTLSPAPQSTPGSRASRFGSRGVCGFCTC